jgi:hypothetical protein
MFSRNIYEARPAFTKPDLPKDSSKTILSNRVSQNLVEHILGILTNQKRQAGTKG